MKQHTQGPWQYDPDQRLVYAERDGGTEAPTIADVLDTTEGLEGDCPAADANGRLVAAAPDLLAACETLDRGWSLADRDPGRAARLISEGRRLLASAVAKAKGGPA